MQIKNKHCLFGHFPAQSGEAEMALASDPAVSTSGPTASDPGARSVTAPREYKSGGQDAQIADKLRQAADILAAQGADPFRIAAYRKAAESIRALNDNLSAIAARGGREALEAVPGVGTSIASAIAEMLTTGRWRFLEHLRGAPARKPCSSRSRALGRSSRTASAKRSNSTRSRRSRRPRMTGG